METGVEKIVELNGGEHAPRKTGVNRILELLGGEPAKNKTGVDRIVEILEQGGGGGGSGLPPYTSADIGKVLTIGEGSEPKWDNVPNKVVKTDIPQEMTTFIMSNLQSNIPAAIAAGIGVPTVVTASQTVTDTDGVSALLEDIATAANNNAIIMLGRLTVLDYAPVVTPGADIASLTFTYPIYYASNYAFHIDIVAQCDLTTYNLNAVITLLKSFN